MFEESDTHGFSSNTGNLRGTRDSELAVGRRRRNPNVEVLDVFFSVVVFVLLFVFVYIKFVSRGALGLENEAYGLAKLLLITELTMLAFIALNLGQLRQKMSAVVCVVFLWLLWLWIAVTCSDLESIASIDYVHDLIQVFYCPLFVPFFYLLVRKTPRWLGITNRVALLLITFSSVMYYYVFLYQNMSVTQGFVSLNDVYYLLLLLPWVLVSQSRVIRYFGILFVAFIVFWSMKRTAFIVLVGSLLVYFVCDRLVSRRWVDVRWLTGVVLVAVVTISLFTYVEGITGNTLITRMADSLVDRGSGRLDIYEDVLQLQVHATPYHWVFGHGHNAVMSYSNSVIPVSAHNDWQEVLFDYGLPGLGLYVWFHWLLLGVVWRAVRERAFYGQAMAASYSIFVGMSLTSHLVLYASYFSYLMCFWGAVCALSEHEKEVGGRVCWVEVEEWNARN